MANGANKQAQKTAPHLALSSVASCASFSVAPPLALHTKQQYAVGALGALGLWLGFPNALVHLPFLALLYPWALAVLGTHAPSAPEALRRGWITGLGGSFAALYWLAIPIQNVGGLPWALAIPCAMAMGAYVGLYGGLFSLAAHKLTGSMPISPLRRMVALACLWYGFEMLRNVAFTGFPWLTLSAAFAPYPLLIQGASVLGAYALSAVYVALTLFLTQGLWQHFARTSLRARGQALGAAFLLLLCVLGYGFYALYFSANATQAHAEKTRFPVIMVEGNIDQNIKWEPRIQQATLGTYASLSLNAVQAFRQEYSQGKPLIIWPETAMPFFIEHHPLLGRQLLQLVRASKASFLLGAPAAHMDETGQNRPFNRAYSLNENAELLGYYDKVHLVPFGEYVPSWLQWNVLEGLLQSIGAFSVGVQETPLKNTAFNIHGQEVALALGVLICYEGIFPELTQKRVAHGANVLVILSNDGWFGDSPAPLQHLQLSLLRAVEQGRWLIRTTNTGISAIVDAQGRIHLQGAQFKAQSLTGFAATSVTTTLFHKLYPYIPWVMLALFAYCLGSSYFLHKRTHTRTHKP